MATMMSQQFDGAGGLEEEDEGGAAPPPSIIQPPPQPIKAGTSSIAPPKVGQYGTVTPQAPEPSRDTPDQTASGGGAYANIRGPQPVLQNAPVAPPPSAPPAYFQQGQAALAAQNVAGNRPVLNAAGAAAANVPVGSPVDGGAVVPPPPAAPAPYTGAPVKNQWGETWTNKGYTGGAAEYGNAGAFLQMPGDGSSNESVAKNLPGWEGGQGYQEVQKAAAKVLQQGIGPDNPQFWTAIKAQLPAVNPNENPNLVNGFAPANVAPGQDFAGDTGRGPDTPYDPSMQTVTIGDQTWSGALPKKPDGSVDFGAMGPEFAGYVAPPPVPQPSTPSLGQSARTMFGGVEDLMRRMAPAGAMPSAPVIPQGALPPAGSGVAGGSGAPAQSVPTGPVAPPPSAPPTGVSIPTPTGATKPSSPAPAGVPPDIWNSLGAEAQRQLANPSPYDDELFKRQEELGRRNIDQAYDDYAQQLEDKLAQTGTTWSSARERGYDRLFTDKGRAVQDLTTRMLTERAQGIGSARAAAFGNAMNYQQGIDNEAGRAFNQEIAKVELAEALRRQQNAEDYDWTRLGLDASDPSSIIQAITSLSQSYGAGGDAAAGGAAAQNAQNQALIQSMINWWMKSRGSVVPTVGPPPTGQQVNQSGGMPA